MARPGLRSHLSGSVPISIAFHLGALLLLFIIPLTADAILPSPEVSLPDFVRVSPQPPPPQVLVRIAAPTPSPPLSGASSPAPTRAPSTIQPETGIPPVSPGPIVPDSSGGVRPGEGGLPGSSIISAPVPPDPPKPGPVRVADLPVAPRKTVDARPIYPDLARTARVQGTVVMEAVLDPAGRVTQLRVIKSEPMLDQAAIDAVSQWRYTPSLYGGHPVSVLMTITIRFTLQ